MLILPRKKPELSKGLLVQSLFLDLRGGTDLITQIVQFRAADTALTQNLEAGDTRGMDRENTLDALAVGDAAQRDRLGDAAAVTRDVIVSAMPPPSRAITTPWKAWTRSLPPSMIFTPTSSVSPTENSGTSVFRFSRRNCSIKLIPVFFSSLFSITVTCIPVHLDQADRDGGPRCGHSVAPTASA